MTGNPKDSEWYVTLQEKRKRKLVSLTLSDEARAKLEALAEGRKAKKSEVVEDLILKAKK
jgi:hypothetical protein